MATLDAEGRRRTNAQLMRDWPVGPLGMMPPVTKHEFRAVVDAIDDWIDANQASLNQALPQPFRASASVAQKAYVFCQVARRRAGLLRAEED